MMREHSAALVASGALFMAAAIAVSQTTTKTGPCDVDPRHDGLCWCVDDNPGNSHYCGDQIKQKTCKGSDPAKKCSEWMTTCNGTRYDCSNDVCSTPCTPQKGICGHSVPYCTDN
jgi:hypothetical protein